MDCFKNTCPVCRRIFCCSAHRADHEIKNHSKVYPKLEQDFLVQLFKKRSENLLLKSQNRKASKEMNAIKEKDDNSINENLSNGFTSKNPRKRIHSDINKINLSTSVTMSKARKILIPEHKHSGTHHSNSKNQHTPDNQLLTTEGPKMSSLYNSRVKTSTPIIENIPTEKTPTGNWDYISPASSISFYGTPQFRIDGQSEARPLFRPQSNRASISPLRSIMAKASKYGTENDGDRSLNFNSSKGRRVTFSFSSSRVSSSNGSPLESVQEIGFHEEIQDENREVITSVSSFQSLSEREVSTSVINENYVFEVTSTIDTCAKTSDNGKITDIQRFNEDSLTSFKGGLFSCVTSMFCSAVTTFPLWRGSEGRSKRSRSPERGVEHTVVLSPLPKRPCYPTDLRLNPIRARKPISQHHS